MDFNDNLVFLNILARVIIRITHNRNKSDSMNVNYDYGFLGDFGLPWKSFEIFKCP